jgi:hypothetical protein
MALLTKLWDGIRWLTPIHRWSAAVAIAMGGGTILWIIALTFGITDVAKAPGEVVEAMYQAAQDGQTLQVRKYLTDDAKIQFDLLTPDDKAALLDMLSNGHTTVELSPLGVRNYGKESVTGLIQDLSNGHSDLRIEILTREGRFWRVQWPIGVADWFEANRQFDPYFTVIDPGGDAN